LSGPLQSSKPLRNSNDQFAVMPMRAPPIPPRVNQDAARLPAFAFTERVYVNDIQPRLATITIPTLSSALSVSKPYAAQIRKGERRPHPRHWTTLARLTAISPVKN